ncbi:cysteine protease [Trichoderma arundinaceum]|uniref:Cysteine protease n=1 Tax=Trichoderma arundinaceum TaxID=490622 RepID=A0A395NEB5_TRIAR|nr:cysteine protease [Trichoderma arundinaceum]
MISLPVFVYPSMTPKSNEEAFLGSAVVGWAKYGRDNVAMSTTGDLRQQLSYQGPGRLIVISGHLDEANIKVLELFGVEKGFLDAYKERKAYTPKDIRECPIKSWCWKYPQLLPEGHFKEAICATEGQQVVLLNVSLWVGSPVPILFIERPVALPLGIPPQKAPTSLETELLEAFATSARSLESRLGQVVHERWRDLLARLGMNHASGEAYWDMTMAVEQNLDHARRLHRESTFMCGVEVQDWEDILLRLGRRVGIKALAR